MLALLILPILVSGFIVLSINPKEKLKLHRYDGQLLYLKASKIGLKYFFVVTIFSFLLKDTSFEWISDNFEPVSIASSEALLPASQLESNLTSINSGSAIKGIKTANNDVSSQSEKADVKITAKLDEQSSSTNKKHPISPKEIEPKGKVFSLDLSLVSYVAIEISKAKNEVKVSKETLEQSWLLSLSFLTVLLAYVFSTFIRILFELKKRVSKFLYKNDVVSMSLLGEILKDSPIDYMFYESLTRNKSILISMKSRKIYVGIVNKPGEPSESNAPNQEISLVPAISGYRDKDTLKVILQSEYNIPDNYDSSLVIKVDQIESVSWFSRKVYDGVNGNIDKQHSRIRRSPLAAAQASTSISVKAFSEWWANWWAKLTNASKK